MDVHELALHLSVRVGSAPSDGLMYYVRRGKEIPDHLLPGRALQRLQRNVPRSYEALVRTDWQNVSPWWIKIMCS
jgi:hypothetical protein